jgi:hypothetical protein
MAALHSLLHLDKELSSIDPDHRDKQYEQTSNNLDVSELKELKICLEFAQWAYEESYDVISANCRAAGKSSLIQSPKY